MGELVKVDEMGQRAPEPWDRLKHPPDAETWNKLKLLVIVAVTSEHSRRSYGASLDSWRKWHIESGVQVPFWSKASVSAYKAHLEARGLSPSSVNLQLTAIRKLSSEMLDNELLPPPVQAAISRVKGA